jgi:Ca-activated chloride channel family protein
MNTNEQHEHEHEPSEESRVHTMLCAYVLGEATDDERAEVEQLLAGSEELRAERDRLQATIGLVQTTMAGAGGGDALPAEASNVLTAALAAKQTQRWYRRPVVRMAAAAGVLGLAFVGWRVSRTEVTPAAFTYSVFGDETVARAPASAPAGTPAQALAERKGGASQPLTEDELGQLSKLGYLDGDATARYSGGGKKEDESAAGAEALKSLGYIGDDGAGGFHDEGDVADLAASIEAGGEVLGLAFDKETEANERQFRARSELAETTLEAYEVPLHGSEVAVQLRELGYVESSTPAPATPRVMTASKTVVPSGGGGGGGAAAAKYSKTVGPSSPGPSGPTKRKGKGLRAGAVVDGPATGSDDFFLGRGDKNGFDEVTGEQLRALGYLGDDDRVEELSRRREKDSVRRAAGRGEPRLQRRIEFILNSCTRKPNERPRDMFFRFWGDNPFEWTAIDTLSTFSVDVDTASYALARRYLSENRLPTKEQIRTEEFVNYFDADVEAPVESTFRIATELAPNRFGDGPDSWMLRVAVRGKDVTREERQPLTLTFVVDVSGSMKENNRMELVKHALRLLIGELDARDSISLVAFSKEARLILPMTSAQHRSLIETAIHQLQPDGGTNAEAGLMLGYEQAAAFLAENTHNRVVLLSDGVANIGNTDQQTLTRNVERHRKSGIYLNTVGVGMGNHNDALLEQLANKGDGVCNYVDDEAEARRALVERFTGAFEPIARDVKIQVEFDPQQIERYRLLGYENRAIADADFRNDAVDAGEVNAGHQVVALYELVGTPSNEAGPLATVRLRWKPPHQNGVANAETDAASETAQPVSWKGAASQFGGATPGYRRSVLVAQFAEFLRRSTHARNDSLDQLIAEAKSLDQVLGDDDFTEFVALVERSRQLVLTELNRYDELERALDAIRQAAYLQTQLEELNLRLGHERLYELEAAVARLAERIEWMRTLAAGNEFAITRDELAALERENSRLRAQVQRLLELLLDPKRQVRSR